MPFGFSTLSRWAFKRYLDAVEERRPSAEVIIASREQGEVVLMEREIVRLWDEFVKDPVG